MSPTIEDSVPAPISEETRLNHFESLHSNDPKNPIDRQGFYNEMQSLILRQRTALLAELHGRREAP